MYSELNIKSQKEVKEIQGSVFSYLNHECLLFVVKVTN